MSPLRVPVSFLQTGECTLSPETSKYVLRVHRLGQGDRLVAFDPEQEKEADAVIIDTGRLAQLRIGELRGASRLPQRSLTVIQALAKGSKVDAIVRDATELGATRIVIAISQRSVKRGISDSQRSRWRRIAVEAARQCGRGDVLRIDVVESLLESLPEVGRQVDTALCLHPSAERSMADAMKETDSSASAAILIGPEGGLTDAEIEMALANGFVAVKLGAFVLRAETVCAAALGALTAI